MQVASILLSGFKCFRERERIDIVTSTASHLSDGGSSGALCALLGRNGAGKSTLFEAIDWCLFGKQIPSLRQASYQQPVIVEINFILNDGSRLHFNRQILKGTLSLTAQLSIDGVTSSATNAQLNQLFESVGINLQSDSDKIFIRQNSNSVATASPLALLASIEDAAGTSHLVQSAKEQSDIVIAAGITQSELDMILAGVVTEIENCLPQVSHIIESILLEQEAVVQHLNADSMQIAKSNWNEQKKIVKKIEQEENQVDQEYKEITSNKHTITAKIKTKTNQISTLIKSKDGAQQKIENLTKKYNELQIKAKSIEERNTVLKKKLPIDKQELSKLQSCLSSSLLGANEELSELLSQYIALKESKNVANLKSSIAQRDMMIEVATQKYRDEQEELIRLEPFLEEINNELVSKDKQLAEISLSKASLAKDLIKLHEREATVQEEVNELTNALVGETTSIRDKSAVQSSQLFVKENKDKCVIMVMLHTVIKPKAAYSECALLAVLGDSLLDTLIVKSRNDALICGDLIQKGKKCSIRNIDILNECTSSSNNKQQYRDSRCTPLLSHVHFINTQVMSAINRKLNNWVYFDGVYEEAILLKLHNNVVSSDGYRFFADGEIRTPPTRRTWPSHVLATTSNLDIQGIHDRISELQNQLQCFHTKVTVCSENLAALEISLMENKETKESLRLQASNIATKIVDIQNKSESHTANVDMERLREDKLKLEQLIIENQSELSNMEAEIQKLTGAKTLNVAVVEIEKGMQTKAQILAKQAEIREMEREFKGADKSMGSDLKRLVDLESRISDNLAEVSQLGNQISEAEVGLLELNNISRIVTEQCQTVAASVKQIKLARKQAFVNCSAAEKLCHSEKADFDSKSAEKKHLRIQLDNCLSDLKKYEGQAFGLRSELNRLYQVSNGALANNCEEPTNVPTLSLTRKEIEIFHQKLVLREKTLAAKQCTNDGEILQLYENLQDQRTKLQSTIDSKVSEATAAKQLQVDFENQRFNVIKEALERINAHIGMLYSRIVKGGDCFLSYPSDQLSLFREGVQLRAQHGNSSWLDISKLSGGQQATCGLSLVLAMQELTSFPFYFMDEIDASLDTRTVTRMGQLLLERTRTKNCQYIIVSHRPELHEYATSVTGLYICKGVPKAFSHSFEASSY